MLKNKFVLFLFVLSTLMVTPYRIVLAGTTARNNATSTAMNPDNSSEAIRLQACFMPGTVVVTCGCWGPAMPGETFEALACCSGQAVAIPCNWMCPTGGVAWLNRCL